MVSCRYVMFQKSILSKPKRGHGPPVATELNAMDALASIGGNLFLRGNISCSLL